ncbi:MAG: PAS domain S-box protein [Lentisphaerae bacterium]|nr:PAS domain S-box protein [Lentisphaerota bacterium]
MSTATPLPSARNLAQTIRIDILPRFSDTDASGDKGRDAGALRRTLLNVADYRFLFENAYDATLLTHEDGRIIVANARAEWLLRCDEKTLQEMNVQHIVSGMDESVLASINAGLQTARFMRITAWCARSEGEPFPAEIAVTRLEHAGEVWLCFFIRDETVKRRDEEALRTVHNAMQNAGTGIAVADLDGRLVHTNPALRRMWRIADADAPTLTLAALLGEPVAEAVMTVVQPDAPPTWTHELPVHHDTEDPRWIQISAAANTDPDNVATGVVLSFVDVSDRFRADAIERLRERDQIMAQSLGAVCHHLGQPTTVLLSSIEMLQLAGNKDPALVKSLLEMSMTAAEEIRQILRKLNEMDVYKAVPYLASATEAPATAIIALDASI